MNIVTIKSLLADGCRVLAHVSVREMCSIKTIVNPKTGDQYYWFSTDWANEESEYFVDQLTRKDGSNVRGCYALKRLEDQPKPKQTKQTKKSDKAAQA